MKFPYGIANFEKIRSEDYFYVDKTRYIEQLEQLSEMATVVLRSRRFGKTLFANMLGWYYDQRYAERFESLFKGTYIYDHPTPKRGAYMMLTFNFSGINTQTLDNANKGFTTEVNTRVRVFTGRYREFFSESEREHILGRQQPNDMLYALFSSVEEKGLGQCIFIVIDEYDHFANNLLSQGKDMFKDLVQTDGYVRPFYEALKKGTESVVDRIFITGVMPILLDSLTSGFNIGVNLSTDSRFNEMFGFTQEEIEPILDYLGDEISRDTIRTYYNGYRFSPRATQRVYNSDMVLYYALRYDRDQHYIETMVDINVVSDYRKIRAILTIGDPGLEETVLTRIVAQKRMIIPELQQLFVLTRETEFLFNEEALISLLFYMGYLTIVQQTGFGLTLRIPNLVLESLYWDYMHYILTKRANLRIGTQEKMEMIDQLLEGKLDQFVRLTEQFLARLSNRDYERFDEKYIKIVMLSVLSDIKAYIPYSEYEVGAAGYVDLYLQAAYEPQRSAHYFLELKYVKAHATNSVVDQKQREGVAAMQKYLQSEPAKTIDNLQPYLLIFRKDKCVRTILVKRPYL